jgi:hypothetical protein
MGFAAVAGSALILPAATSGFAVITHPSVLWVTGIAVGLLVTATVVYGCWRLAVAEVPNVGEHA